MSLGLSPRQSDMFATTTGFCGPLVAPDSVYGLLYRECDRLFPDEMFADLFADVGRRCVPPMIVAVVMVLQRLEGCSDREAVERFQFDLRGRTRRGGLGVWVERLGGSADGGAVTRFKFVVRGSTRRAGWGSTIPGSCTRCWSTC